MRRAVPIAFILTLLCPAAWAATWFVAPDGTGDFPTIQAATDSAVNGDLIELGDGTFQGVGNRDIDYHGKAITIRSRSGDAASCIIDCEGSAASPHRAIYFHSGEGPTSILSGVTVTNGYTSSHGGGIRCSSSSSPRIADCVLSMNVAEENGGGINCSGGSAPELIGCRFEYNYAEIYGGGLRCTSASPTVTGCSFTGNTSYNGGGISCYPNSDAEITDCTFAGNSATNGAGLFFVYSSPTVRRSTIYGNFGNTFGAGFYLVDAHPTVENTIIAFNIGADAISCYAGAAPSLSCCDIYGNELGDWTACIEDQIDINGNLAADPLFCDTEMGDLTLREDSPCAPFTEPNSECDRIGAWPVQCSPTGLPETIPATEDPLYPRGLPNPFRTSTRIAYEISAGSSTTEPTISIHDAAGRLVRILGRIDASPGLHSIEWDGTDRHGDRVAAGVYFVIVRAGKQPNAGRLLLLR